MWSETLKALRYRLNGQGGFYNMDNKKQYEKGIIKE
jgi:hypothetical protein